MCFGFPIEIIKSIVINTNVFDELLYSINNIEHIFGINRVWYHIYKLTSWASSRRPAYSSFISNFFDKRGMPNKGINYFLIAQSPWAMQVAIYFVSHNAIGLWRT